MNAKPGRHAGARCNLLNDRVVFYDRICETIKCHAVPVRRRSNVVGDGHILPVAVENRDTLEPFVTNSRRDGWDQGITPCRGLNQVAVNNDICRRVQIDCPSLHPIVMISVVPLPVMVRDLIALNERVADVGKLDSVICEVVNYVV